MGLNLKAKPINLPSAKIKIGSKIITVEVAKTQRDRNQGLMHRTKLKKDNGMLFVFKREAKRNFWMKNTFLPLDIAYFSKKKVLLEIHKAQPVKSVIQQSIPKYPSKYKAKFVIEMNQGWFKKNKIKIGQKFNYL